MRLACAARLSLWVLCLGCSAGPSPPTSDASWERAKEADTLPRAVATPGEVVTQETPLVDAPTEGEGWLGVKPRAHADQGLSRKQASPSPSVEPPHLQLSGPPLVVAGEEVFLQCTLSHLTGPAAARAPATVTLTLSDATASGPSRLALRPMEGGRTVLGAPAAVTFRQAGVQLIDARHAPSGTSANHFVQVLAGHAAHYRLAVSSLSTAGEPQALELQIQDAFGNAVTADATRLMWRSSDRRASLPTLTDGASSGRSSRPPSTVVWRTAGWQRLQLLSMQGTVLASQQVQVVAAAAERLQLELPRSVPAGQPCQLTVVSQDAFGNRARLPPGVFSVVSTDPTAILPPRAVLAPPDPLSEAHSEEVVLLRAGEQHLAVTAEPSGWRATASIWVRAHHAAYLHVTAPETVTAGEPFSYAIEAMDAFGNPRARYRGALRVTSSDASASLVPEVLPCPSDTVACSVAGQGARFYAPGAQYLTVADPCRPTLAGQARIWVQASPIGADEE